MLAEMLTSTTLPTIRITSRDLSGQLTQVVGKIRKTANSSPKTRPKSYCEERRYRCRIATNTIDAVWLSNSPRAFKSSSSAAF